METREELNRLIRFRERRVITRTEFFGGLLTYLGKFPEQKSDVLRALSDHPNRDVREVFSDIWNLLRNESLSKDLDHLRRASPLQPGTRLILFGGYDFYSSRGKPRWLNGRDYYKATFISFVQRRRDSVPVACVELDEAFDLAEHKGRFALLLDRYSSASAAWSAEGTVTVHIVERLPEDFEAFYASHPFGTEVETHAQYEITPSLCAIAKEIGQALDDLNVRADEQTAGYAARRLRRLLADAPALRPSVVPALIQKLHHAGDATPVAARGLLRELGPAALRALIGYLPSEDSWVQAAMVAALATFGSEAKEALPELEKLLHGDLHVRIPAAMAIWRIAGRTPEMAKIVVEGLQLGYTLAEEAGDCLREMGPDAAEVVPVLVELLTSAKIPSSRAAAAVAIGGMGLDAVQAIPALIEAAQDSNEEVRGSALRALRELRALARVGELILLEFDGEPSQRR
jgi:HEAT repeat protein